MSLETLNYYGYSKETYQNCLEYIQDTDFHHAKILNVWFTILCIIVYLLSKLKIFTLMSGNPAVYLSYFVLAMLWFVFVALPGETSPARVQLAVLFNILWLYSFSIYSSVVQPYMAASIFPVIIVVIGLSYIGTFLMMGLVLIGGCTVFLSASFVFKPLAIAYIDIYNIILFLILAFILHYTFQKMRISRYVIYYEMGKMKRDLEIKSNFDALTFLLNRGSFFELAAGIARSAHDEYIVLCLFDLDGFKQINDKLGHQTGDLAIQAASEQIMKGFAIDFGAKWNFLERAPKEKLSFAGRLGGDEFVVFVRGRRSREAIVEETSRILEQLQKVEIGELKGIRSSVGIVELSSADFDIDKAYAKADEALYNSKAAGKHTITYCEN